MSSRLGIHVIGPRYGECVVLELPDGTIAVVDCFADRHGIPSLIGFLHQRFPTLTRLRFLAITHPHADHCWGASRLAREFDLDEFSIFSPFPAGLVQHYYDALKRLGTCDAVEQALELPAGAISLELLSLDERISELWRRRRLPIRYFGPRSFTLCGGRLSIHMLIPGDKAKFVYNGQLDQAAKALLTDGPKLRASGNLPQVDHNLASGGMLIEYGQTRILLMADGEEPLWQE